MTAHFFFESRTDIEIGIALLYNHLDQFGLKMHIGTEKKPSKNECIFTCPQVPLMQKYYCSINSPTPPWSYRRKKLRKRDAHPRTKNIPSAEKHRLSK